MREWEMFEGKVAFYTQVVNPLTGSEMIGVREGRMEGYISDESWDAVQYSGSREEYVGFFNCRDLYK